MAPIVYPRDRDDAAVMARRLLHAAGQARRSEVRTVSDGPAQVGFDVPDDLVDAALGVEASDLSEDEPAGERHGGLGDSGVDVPTVDAAGEEVSAVAGAGESEVAKSGGGSSPPPARGSKARSAKAR